MKPVYIMKKTRAAMIVWIFGLVLNLVSFSLMAEIRCAIDLGSNNVKLGCFKIDQDQILKRVFNAEKCVSLQNGIHEGILSLEVQANAVRAIKELLSDAKINPEKTKVIAIATAWARKATNSRDLIEKIKTETEVTIEIIDQETEGEIGFYAAQSELRTLLLNKNSFLYQTDSGAKIREKITGMNTKNLLNPQHIMSWDIGGGSMQFATANEGNKIEVFGSTMGVIPFTKLVIDGSQKSPEDSPNPLSAKQVKRSIVLAMKKAEETIETGFAQHIQSSNTVVFGIGPGHKIIRTNINKLLGVQSENSYMQSDLEKAVLLLTNMDDTEIAKTLGIKPSEAKIGLTGMLLILGHMKYFNIDKIYTLDVNGTSGVLFYNLKRSMKPAQISLKVKPKLGLNVKLHLIPSSFLTVR
jgi:exopolyphosphatase/pppGpp-phosphohydrolase